MDYLELPEYRTNQKQRLGVLVILASISMKGLLGMKIVHIASGAPYNDYWGYQENLLPKYQKRLGHDVTLIITNTMHKDGKIVETDCADYVLNDGVRVIRLKRKQYPHIVLTNLNSRLPVYQYLKEIKPDFVFYHGLNGTTILDVIRYKKRINPKCIIVQDNHLDANNFKAPKGIKGYIIGSYQRCINRLSIPYISRVYGVTPWRRAFAEEYYHIPHEKTDVLIMGADDERIDFENRDTIRRSIRAKFGINDSDFLIVTGGKIEKRKNTYVLMTAVARVKGAKLLIFGSIEEDIQEDFDRLLAEHDNIIYIGWIHANDVYNYFFAADLACFPGQHSVLWEQACAAKVPCVFEKWEGMEHVDNGGNSEFVTPVTEGSLESAIRELMYTDKYYRMKAAAESEKTDIYLYSRIAEKSLESANPE